MSLDRVWESSRVSLREVQIETRDWLDSTRNDRNYIDVKKCAIVQKIAFCFLTLSQSAVVTIVANITGITRH